MASRSTTHFVPDTYPYRPGTTIRTGNPCSGGNASPFIPMTSNAPRPGSITTDIGVPVYQPSVLRLNSWSAAGSTPASSRMSRSGTPMKLAVEMRLPPTGFETHVIVIGRSTSGRPIRFAKSA